MAADGTPGTKKQPQFLGSGAPATATDLNILSDFAALVGNRKVGTTTERTTATSAGEVWEGLAWFDTTLGLELLYLSAAWVVAPPRICTVRRSASQSIASGSFTSVQFDTEVEDDYNMWASGNPTRVVVPISGLYIVTGGAGIPTGSTGRVATRFLVNGAEYPVGGRLNALGSQADAGAGATALIPLVANDYVELSVFHDAGSSRNIGSDAPYSTPFLSVALLRG